ncbi:unnamed protein product [Meganyctiphanes norvegica]|uniref:CBM21 domain-containing protein n=1 Tax=Meganyctiphanes norvegica TaxID=48144 RepID=A0AAV2PLW1_MEGNR
MFLHVGLVTLLTRQWSGYRLSGAGCCSSVRPWGVTTLLQRSPSVSSEVGMDGSGDLRPLYFTTSNPHPAARRPVLQPYAHPPSDLRSVPGRARPYTGRPMDCTQPRDNKPDSSPKPPETREIRVGPNRPRDGSRDAEGPTGDGEHISRRGPHRGRNVNTDSMPRQPLSPPEQQMLSPTRQQTMSPTVISDLNRPLTRESGKHSRGHGHDSSSMSYPSMVRHEGPPMSPGGYANVPSHDGSGSPCPYSSMSRHEMPLMSPGYANVPRHDSHSGYCNLPRHEVLPISHSAYPGIHYPDVSPMMSPSGYSNMPHMTPVGFISVPRQEDPISSPNYSSIPRNECPPTYSNIPRHNGASAEEIITDAFRDIHKAGQSQGDKQTQSEFQEPGTGKNPEEHHEGVSVSVQVSLPIPATSPCGCLTPPCASPSPTPVPPKCDNEVPDKIPIGSLGDEMYKNHKEIFRTNSEPKESVKKDDIQLDKENNYSDEVKEDPYTNDVKENQFSNDVKNDQYSNDAKENQYSKNVKETQYSNGVQGDHYDNGVQHKPIVDTSSEALGCKYCDGHPREGLVTESGNKVYEDKGSVTSPDKEFVKPDTLEFKNQQTKATNTKGQGTEDEDIVEEVYITGRFRNLRGYAERVQQLVEEKIPTPTKEAPPTFDESSFQTEEQTIRVDKAVGTEKEGVRFDERKPERHVYESENIEMTPEYTIPEEKIQSPLREKQNQNRHSVFSTISEKPFPEPVIEEVQEERRESDIQMCEIQVPEGDLYASMTNEPFPVTEHPEARSNRDGDIPIETLTRSFSDEHLDDLKKYMKRPSSLKYPGTIGRRKKKNLIVQFADMCTCFDGEIQRSPFWERGIDREFSGFNPFHRPPPFPRRVLTPLFTEPGKQLGFLKKIKTQKVSMEKVIIGNDLSVCGIVRVLNLAFEKRVYVRYSYDHWRNYNEAQASYILGSCDGYSDQFSFLLEADSLMDHDALIFCVRYRTVNQQEYWDNNGGRNYVIKCFGASAGGASGAAKISEGYRGSSSYLQVPSY